MQPFQMCWGGAVSPDFRSAVIDLCVETPGWGIEQANDLMTCMAQEAGPTFSPSVVNKAGTGATGLIQFMPDTAISLGTTVQELARMTAVKQLVYVKKYFKPYAAKIKSLEDMYMAILLPKYVGAPDDTVLFTDNKAYRQNSGLDADKDGKITKFEVSERVREIRERGLAHGAWENWPQ